nr:PerC family transcriptional regulator [Escherichia coli]
MVNDSKAEDLEAKGLYRRAAARWMEVMLLCTEDDDLEWIKRRRETCLENVKRPPVKVEDFGDLHKACPVSYTHLRAHETGSSSSRMPSSA